MLEISIEPQLDYVKHIVRFLECQHSTPLLDFYLTHIMNNLISLTSQVNTEPTMNKNMTLIIKGKILIIPLKGKGSFHYKLRKLLRKAGRGPQVKSLLKII